MGYHCNPFVHQNKIQHNQLTKKGGRGRVTRVYYNESEGGGVLLVLGVR